jgi:GNAT superfamily N-acetyltransferase
MTRNRKPSSPFTAPQATDYLTKKISKQTWRDFERLFQTHPAPGAYPCWCMYNHRPGPTPCRTGDSRAAWIERNRREKKALVEQGRSHGILVYAQGEPVGWCQYGLREELPRIENNPKYPKLATGSHKAMWRITCFVVQRKYRRRGVASAVLRAVLTAIQDEGGGLVEAYPIKRWGAYAEFRGTLSMFQKEGFRIVAPLGESNVMVQRIVPAEAIHK